MLCIHQFLQSFRQVFLNENLTRYRRFFLFTGLDGVKFRRQVVPGDRLDLECSNLRMKLKLCKMDARAYVDGKLAAEAQITAAIGDRPKA